MSDTVLVTPQPISHQSTNAADVSPELEYLTQRVRNHGDELLICKSRCRNCPDCWEHEKILDSRRKFTRLSRQTTHFSRPTVITLCPEKTTTDLGKLCGKLVLFLKRNHLLSSGTYFWKLEVGFQSGRLHAHVLIDAAVSEADLRNAIDRWSENLDTFTFHTGIDVRAFDSTVSACKYICKPHRPPAPFILRHLLPRKGFGKSQDLTLSPQKSRKSNPGIPRRNPRTYAPREWSDNPDCAKTVEIRTVKKNTNLPTSRVFKTNVAWEQCSQINPMSKYLERFVIGQAELLKFAAWLRRLSPSSSETLDRVTIDDVHADNFPDEPEVPPIPELPANSDALSALSALLLEQSV